jgi:hypothetical protein
MAHDTEHTNRHTSQRPHLTAQQRNQLQKAEIHLTSASIALSAARGLISCFLAQKQRPAAKTAQGDLQQTIEHDVH